MFKLLQIIVRAAFVEIEILEPKPYRRNDDPKRKHDRLLHFNRIVLIEVSGKLMPGILEGIDEKQRREEPEPVLAEFPCVARTCPCVNESGKLPNPIGRSVRFLVWRQWHRRRRASAHKRHYAFNFGRPLDFFRRAALFMRAGRASRHNAALNSS